MRAYVQLKNVDFRNKQELGFTLPGEIQVYDVENMSLDEAWCAVYTSVPNVQRVLIPIE